LLVYEELINVLIFPFSPPLYIAPDPSDPPPAASEPDVEVDEDLFTEDPVAVDESLFDVDNLQDLDLDDPAILEDTPS